jgi:outer membrane protein TolC
LSKNTEIALYNLLTKQAEQEKLAANSYLYPKINIGFAGQLNIDIAKTPVPGELVGQPSETAYLEFGQKYAYSGGATISKTLFDWQARAHSDIAKLNVSLGKAQNEYYQQTLKEQIAQVYYATLACAEAVTLGKKDLNTADSIFSATDDRFAQGLIDGMIYNQAKINRNKVLQQLEQNSLNLNRCTCDLKLLIGLSVSDTLVLSENLIVDAGQPTLPYTLGLNKQQTEIYRLKSTISDIEVRKSKAKFMPKIELSSYFGFLQYQDDFVFSFNQPDVIPNNYLGVSVSIPLFTGFANKAQYNSSKISGHIAGLAYQDEIRKSAINDAMLLNEYYASFSIAENAACSFSVMGNSVRLAAQKHAQGLYGTEEYLKVFEDYLAAENLYMNKLTDFLAYKAILEARTK